MRRSRKVMLGAIGAIASLAWATSASALTTPPVTGSIPLTTTNWTRSITIPKFDPSLGTLSGVSCTIAGTAVGTARVENTATEEGNTITIVTSAKLTLFKPDSSGPLVITIPLVNDTQALPAFDGTVDVGGASGSTLPQVTGTDANTGSYSDAATLAMFVAASPGETVTLPIKAQATSSATDTAGNFERSLTTRASADVSCTYSYTVVPPAEVPEFPLTIVASGGAAIVLGGATFAARRARRA